MRLRLSLLGQELWSVQWCRGCDCCEDEDEAPAPEPGGRSSRIAAGETHNFERDANPLDPADHYGEWEDRKRFGFGVRS